MAVKTFGSPTTLKSVKKLIDKKAEWQAEITQFQSGIVTLSGTTEQIRGLDFTPKRVIVWQIGGTNNTASFCVITKDEPIMWGGTVNSHGIITATRNGATKLLDVYGQEYIVENGFDMYISGGTGDTFQWKAYKY